MSSTRSRRKAGRPAALTSPRRAAGSVPSSRSGEAPELRVRPSSGNVFLDLGFAPQEAENLKLRADLMIELGRLIETRGLTQAQAAKLLGVTQPRVSDLVRGKISLFSVDTLIGMLGRAGLHVSLAITAKARVA